MVFGTGKTRFATAMESARHLLEETGRQLPVDICRVARLLGYVVEEAEIRWAGYLAAAENRIVVRRSDTPARKRFTIAHEIGHVLWRKASGESDKQKRLFKGGAYSQEERIANELATELLMPLAEFEVALLQYRWPSLFRVRDIATLFGVSFEACARRITELPNTVAFAYSYEVYTKNSGECEIRLNKGYSTGDKLRFTNPPFDIVRQCLQHNLHTSRMWVGRIRFQRDKEQIQIPSVGETIRKNGQTWVRLLGWRHLDSPVVGTMQANQLVAF